MKLLFKAITKENFEKVLGRLDTEDEWGIYGKPYLEKGANSKEVVVNLDYVESANRIVVTILND